VLVEEAQRKTPQCSGSPTASRTGNDVVIIRLVTHRSGFGARPARRRADEVRCLQLSAPDYNVVGAPVAGLFGVVAADVELVERGVAESVNESTWS
jgi:hypothetical protein